MTITVVGGMSFGDEGKGKIVDYLAEQYDVVARFNGGNNAGHSIWVNNNKYVFHLIPSGILYPNKICLIGNGTVIDLEELRNELDNLHGLGIKTKGRLFISNNAHVISKECVEEDKAKNKHLGTTGRGIGPTYAFKAARNGRRIIDVAPDFIRPYLSDTVTLINDYIDSKKAILCEGAQGAMLDIDHGTYPYVTSCNTVAASACIGLGFGPTKITNVIGVTKAYVTRVGTGPFPTELFDKTGEKIQTIGKEFGATTGRARRCGWLDLPMLRYACKINGTTKLAITKLDVLDTFDSIELCTGYEWDGMIVEDPAYYQMFEGKPVYKTFPGWKSSQYRATGVLCDKLNNYLEFIESSVGVPIKLVSTGPERNAVFIR